MKRVLKLGFILCLSVYIVSFWFLSVYAHPGRTDANGCHVCRTNCEKWNLDYDEYHCHNEPESTEKKVTENSSFTSVNTSDKKSSIDSTNPVIFIFGSIIIFNLGLFIGYKRKK